MQSHIPKFIFVGILALAAIATRGNYHATSQEAANVVSVTAAGTETTPNGTSSGEMLDRTGSTAVTAGVGTMMSGTSTPTIKASVGTSPFVRVGNDPVPTLAYHEVLIADLMSGDVVFGDGNDTRWPIASITKLMTAEVAIDTLDLTQSVTITPDMMAVDGGESTLKAGDSYTGSDLLRILLLRSSNVAAEALAVTAGRDTFMRTMNARAESLGMQNTHYSDPAGLSSANQSTADDLWRLAQNLYTAYPQILSITRMPSAIVTNTATGKKITIKTIIDFAGQRDFVGGKTGYTDLANGNLLSIFTYQNRPVLVVIMGTDEASRFVNTTALYNWFKKNYK